MEDMELERLIMELVVDSGDARSKALEAIRAARGGNFDQSTALLQSCDEALHRAHHRQTDLIQMEAAGKHTQVSLFLVHAQDHLMNAMTVRDLAEEMIYLIKENKS